jgi:VWFA-related protein
MFVRRIASASLAFLVPLAALAQQQPSRTYGETLEVRVINVDVVVTGRDGKPVTGLTKDDFELFRNGKRKEISNFLEINERSAASASAATTPSGAAAPMPGERRHLIVFVDNTSLQPFNRDRVLTAMQTFIESTMRSNDAGMVVSWNPGLKENQPLTGNRALIIARLQEMMGTTAQGTMLRVSREQTENELRTMLKDYGATTFHGGGVSAASPPTTDPPQGGGRGPGGGDGPGARGARLDEKPPYDRALGAVRQYANSVMSDTKLKAEALRGLMLAFNGVQGRKALIFVTESFSTQPARQMFEYLDAIKDEFDKGSFQNPRAEITQYNDEPLFQIVTSAANAAGVTLYPISATGVTGGIDGADASDRGNAVHDRPVGKAPGKLVEQSLQELAAATGGLAVTGTNDFAFGLNRIANDLTMYYSLGYRADAPQSDAAEKLEVRVKKPGLAVRYRETQVRKAAPTEIADTMSANLFAGIQKNDMGVTVSIGAPAAKDDYEVIVPVIVTIPVTSLTWVPDGNDVAGKFAIFAGFTRKDGTSSKVSKVEYPLRFPAASMQDRRNISVKISMTMNKTTENVSVGVLDETSNATGFATAKLP